MKMLRRLRTGWIEWRAHAQFKRAVRLALQYGLITQWEADRRLAYSRKRYEIFKRHAWGHPA
jgi:hypothetical protein